MTDRRASHRAAAHKGSSEPGYSCFRIDVVAKAGEGRTPLSAFDAALQECGAQNYNLLTLSSVIPPASRVVVCDRYKAPAGEYGHKLYVVMAEMRSSEPGAVIAAGLGWLQEDDGRGVFVEHEARMPGGDCAATERELASQISTSLRDLAARRAVEFVAERVGSLIAVTRVGRQSACVLALAVYQSEGWR